MMIKKRQFFDDLMGISERIGQKLISRVILGSKKQIAVCIVKCTNDACNRAKQ